MPYPAGFFIAAFFVQSSEGLLWRHGPDINIARLTGNGQLIVLQGGFLLASDTALWLLHRPLTLEVERTGIGLEVGSGKVVVRY